MIQQGMHAHAVVIFAEICCDLMNRNWIPATTFLIISEIPLMKRAAAWNY